MGNIILGVLLIVLAVGVPFAVLKAALMDKQNRIPYPSVMAEPVAMLLFLSAIYDFSKTSFVYVPAGKVAHLYRHYGASLPEGHYIAANGEKGPQAEVITSGFHLSGFVS